MKIITTITALLISSFGFTQNFEFDPSNTVEITKDSHEVAGAFIIFKNVSNKDRSIRWTTLKNTYGAAGWTPTLCTHIACHTYIPQTGNLGVIKQGEKGDFIIDAKLNNKVGYGEVTIRIYDVNDPTYFDTVFVKVTSVYTKPVDKPTGIYNTVDGKGINVFPNPASNSLFITMDNNEKSEFTLLNVGGLMVRSGLLTENNNQIHVSDLKQGIYFLTIRKENGFIYQKKIIIK